MTKCLRCNRELKKTVCIERGYGNVCWAKIQAQREQDQQEERSEHIDIPLDEFIVCERRVSGIATNVPRLVIDHSPTGFEFGYGGSGPADFALNILEVVLRQIGYEGETTKDTWHHDRCFKLSMALHQAFKWDFVAGMSHEGGKIATNDIINWIESHKPMYEEVQ